MIKQKFILEGEQEYLVRLKVMATVELVTGSIDKIPSKSFVIALDENGDEFTSEKFAGFIQKKTVQGKSDFTFLIGAAAGLSKEQRERANATLSLSKLTFPYQMARFILVEQLYRAMSIIKGKPYHKE